MGTWGKNFVDYRKVSRVSVAGRSFASKFEAEIYQRLCLQEAGGEVKDIRCQDHVFLTEARIEMIPDFRVFDNKLAQLVWHEAKGYVTDVFRIKRKLWTVYGPGRLVIYKGGAKSYRIAEVIIPRESRA